MALTAPAAAPGLARPGSSDHMPRLSYHSSSASQVRSSHKFEYLSESNSTEDAITFVSSEKTSLRPRPSLGPSPTRQSTQTSKSSSNSRNSTLSSQHLQSHRSSRSSRSPVPGAKKKSSFLTGVFAVQEPSMVALAHMEAQMKQQKPSKSGERINPVGMPGVSSAKLPPTVPKVNAKWDGLPDAMKQKGKEPEKERRWSRSSKSESSSARSRSTDPTNRQLHLAQASSHSTFDSFEIHTFDAKSEKGSFDSSGTQTKEIRTGRTFSSRPPSWRSSSGASLPDISILLPNDAPPPPAIPEEFRPERNSTKPIPRTHPSPTPEPPTEVPAHTTSPLPTPTDSDPETPTSLAPPTSLTYIEPNAFHFPWGDVAPPPIPQRNAARLQPLPKPIPTIPLRPSRSYGLLAEEARPPSNHSSHMAPIEEARPPSAYSSRSSHMAPIQEIRSFPTSSSFQEDDLPDPALLSPIPEIRFNDDENSGDGASYITTETDLDRDQRQESSRQRLGLMATMKKDVERPPWDDPMYLEEEEEEEQQRRRLRFSFLGRGGKN